MANADLTAERLRELLDYDPETGLFTWRAGRNQKSTAGKVAGWVEKVNGRERRAIEVDQRNYKAHRLAWLYVHGAWPSDEIDHVNGDSLDNRIANLRQADRSLNLQNRRRPRKGSKSGLLGACWDEAKGRWLAVIMANGQRHHIGYFDTAQEAHAAYVHKKRLLHAGCTI